MIYSAPKVGKTTALNLLENNLILDLEKGTDKLEALKIETNSLRELYNVAAALRAKNQELGRPAYSFLTLDTITTLEDWCGPYATEMYKKSPQGANFEGNDVLTLPNGAGYLWLRKAFNTALSWIDGLAPTVILVAHLRDKLLEKAGTEVAGRELDLTGKIRNIVSSQVDAIGYVYREADRSNELRISFKSSESVISGSRCPHLAGQDFVLAVSEIVDGQHLITTNHWNKIFID